MTEALQRLSNKGVRFGTIIDVGCADGLYALRLISLGLAPDAVPLNIDANRIYEDSLREIASVVGGHYRIAAATDFVGEIELTTSAHPYWASLRPHDDTYWQRVNGLAGGSVKVPATTLDHLGRELSLKPPFLLKLDVQGAEESALRGAREILSATHVVVCEADVDDFQKINSILVDAGFLLYDLESINRTPDGTLGWFYPVYIHRDLEFVRPGAFWNEQDNERVIRLQIERRRSHLEYNARVLAQLRQTRMPKAGAPASEPPATVGRNTKCSCGSGKKYKHCCGART